MIVDLTGVIQDGTPFGVDVPENTRRALRVAHGEDITIRLKILRPDGSFLDPTNRRFVFTLRRRTDPAAVIKREGTVNTLVEGQVDFHVDDKETLGLQPGNFAYDIWTFHNITLDHTPMVPLSTLVLEPSLFPVTGGPITADPCPPIDMIPFTSLFGTLAELNAAISDADVASTEEILALFRPQNLVRLDEVSGDLTYIGEAETPGTATSAASWRIVRLDESGTGGEELIKQYANGSTDFDQIWDDRASLSYS